jgi:hypothetical protein
MEASIHSRYPTIKVYKSAKKLSYELDVDVETYEPRRVTVVFEADRLPEEVRVFADGPRSLLTDTRATPFACGTKRTHPNLGGSPSTGWSPSSR